MSHFTAVLDACVLHSYPLTSVLMELAEARLYRACWSADIHAEWMRSVHGRRPDIAVEKLERRRMAMDMALPDACVTGYQRLIDALTLPDPDDRHVLAAAIRAKAQVIVTFNEADFPNEVLADYGVCAWHPDSFLCLLIDLAPRVVHSRIQSMAGKLANPPMAMAEYIAMLERQALPEATMALRRLFV